MSNGEAAEIRKKSAQEAMDDAAAYLESGEGRVAIVDGTNSSPMARAHVADFFTKLHRFNLLFIECICDDPDLLGTNTKARRHPSPSGRVFPFDHVYSLCIMSLCRGFWSTARITAP